MADQKQNEQSSPAVARIEVPDGCVLVRYIGKVKGPNSDIAQSVEPGRCYIVTDLQASAAMSHTPVEFQLVYPDQDGARIDGLVEKVKKQRADRVRGSAEQRAKKIEGKK